MANNGNTIVYTLGVCPNCKIAKNMLKEHGIDFEEKSMSDPDALTELNIDKIFPLSAPVIYYNSEYHLSVDSLAGVLHE